MAWLKIDDRVRTHPKIVEAGPQAAWVWFCGICYCREHLTDGFISDKIMPTLVPGLSSPKKAAAALVAAGLWHREPRGYRVHDFLDWNPSRADVEAQRAADRDRKSGIQPESNRNPTGIREESLHTRDARAMRAGVGYGYGSGSEEGSSPEGGLGETVTRAPRGGSILGVMPLDYEKRKRYNAHVGERLDVPSKLHADLVRRLGGADPDGTLRAWYAALDAEIAQSGESIAPDVWKWLEARYALWQASTAPGGANPHAVGGEYDRLIGLVKP